MFQKIKNLFRLYKTYHFFVYELNNNHSVPKQVILYVNNFFKRRFSKITYFELVVIKNKNKQFVIYGNENPKKINKNVVLFALEVYAHIESNKRISISKDYNKEELTIKGEKIMKFMFKPLKIEKL